MAWGNKKYTLRKSCEDLPDGRKICKVVRSDKPDHFASAIINKDLVDGKRVMSKIETSADPGEDEMLEKALVNYANKLDF